ncbi:MAG: ATP-binding protein [Williamsia sp.]|nr:ATP-binding protein [Williamsia sp.]
MTDPENKNDWSVANQRYLMASLRLVREELEAYRTHLDKQSPGGQEPAAAIPAEEELKAAAETLPALSALDSLSAVFGLSGFERKVLLLCAGVELDAGFSKLVTTLQGDPSGVHPSFALALAAFPDAHWSALSPAAPLRYWQLVEINPKELVTKSPLRIDETILHYLTGVRYLNNKVKEICEPVYLNEALVRSHLEVVDKLLLACGQPHPAGLPLVQLSGENHADKAAVAANVCARLGFQLYQLQSFAVPGSAGELAEMARLWNREAALNGCALLLDCTRLDTSDKLRMQGISSFLDNLQGLVFLGCDEWKPASKRRQLEFRIHRPQPDEQLLLWQTALGDRAHSHARELQHIVSHFNLSTKTIGAAAGEVMILYQGHANGQEATAGPATGLAKEIWQACRKHTQLQVDQLAQRIEPVARWNDIVLPEAQKQILKEIALQVKHRSKVYREWGFAGKDARGLGISVLFTGESGTGKTMASEVLANELALSLYRIDLSQVVNKYIGETEKNLKQIFDAAEEGGAILLFDEADALFGKRSDVKDSHDRYSNIEVSYLLQRMEAYRGLAILTTNMKSAIDKAFLRRIRFVVQFPYPDALHRAEIWRRIFPAETPVKDLDIDKLSRLSVPGGNIRNIALNAAFMAADENQPVQMHHLSRAARSEYAKLEKAYSPAETGGW